VAELSADCKNATAHVVAEFFLLSPTHSSSTIYGAIHPFDELAQKLHSYDRL
jgi:hypothetical protein